MLCVILIMELLQLKFLKWDIFIIWFNLGVWAKIRSKDNTMLRCSKFLSPP